MNPNLATVLTFAIAVAFLRIMDYFAHRGWISGKLSRKLIHIGTGPIFVLCWLLFPDQPMSRYLAALVPLLITVQFVLVGTGVVKDEAAVQAMTRTGNPREILRGPLFYGIMFVMLTVIYWKDSPIGITALMMMCGGDGIADIVGRRVPSPKLPWSIEKSVAGSLSVLAGGALMTAIVLFVYISAGVFAEPFRAYLAPVFWISLGGMLIESLPFKDIDNITLTVVSAVIGHWVF
ncbi:MAG: dolichol kinase [Anaerolineales bacterium]